jgi:hypothetical protein
MKTQISLCFVFLAMLVLAPATTQARYLNPGTGHFQTMDSYEGNSQDPGSLHSGQVSMDLESDRRWTKSVRK